MKLAAQMFTVRDYAKDLDDLENTLGRIADIGYEYVQVSGTCPYEPEWLREKLDKYGLECVITHIPSERICADTERVIAEHNVFALCKDFSNTFFVWIVYAKFYAWKCKSYRSYSILIN